MDFPYLFSRGISHIFTDPMLTIYFILLIIFVIFYFLFPYDIIPDVLGWIGYADDVSIIGFAVIWVVQRFLTRFTSRVEDEYNEIMAQ